MEDTSTLVQNIEKLVAEIKPIDRGFSTRLTSIAQELDAPEPKFGLISVANFINDDTEMRWQESFQRSRWLPILLQFRTILFIIPILFTWLHLAISLSAYAALVKDAPDLASESFLVLWQTEFANSSPTGGLAIIHAILSVLGVRLTFSSLALGDAILIFLVLVGNVWIGYINEHNYEDARTRSASLRERVEALLDEIDRFVRSCQLEQEITEKQRNQQHTDRLVATFRTHVESIRGLEKYMQAEQKRLETLQTVREEEIEVRRQLATFSREGIGKLNRTIERVEMLSQRMDKMGESMTVAAKELYRAQDALTEIVSQSQKEFIAAIQKLDIQIQRNSEIGEDTIGTVNHTLDRLHGIAAHIQSVVDAQKHWYELSQNVTMAFDRVERFSNHSNQAILQSIEGQTSRFDEQLQRLNGSILSLVHQLATNVETLNSLHANQSGLPAVTAKSPQVELSYSKNARADGLLQTHEISS